MKVTTDHVDLTEQEVLYPDDLRWNNSLRTQSISGKNQARNGLPEKTPVRKGSQQSFSAILQEMESQDDRAQNQLFAEKTETRDRQMRPAETPYSPVREASHTDGSEPSSSEAFVQNMCLPKSCTLRNFRSYQTDGQDTLRVTGLTGKTDF